MDRSPMSRTLSPRGSPVRPGEVIDGKYRVERVVGAGGMGVVVAATHVQLRHAVAVKVLAPRSASWESAVPRFVQEAHAAARIRSEHAVRVFDVGALPGGLPYIVMEYLEGVDLHRVLDRRGPLPLPEALECLLQACEAVGEAHAVGVVHRDLKPANLVRCERPGAPPFVKVVDFGISKLLVAGDPAHDVVVTAAHEILGSPLFAPPEQLRASRDVDARADIWALGAVGYTILAGRPPFEAETFTELYSRIAHSNAIPLSNLRPDVPPALARVIERCLARTPAARFQTVTELAIALAPFAPPRALVSIERLASLVHTPLVRAQACRPNHHPTAGCPSFSTRKGGALHWAVAAAALAVVIVVAAISWLRGGPMVNAPALPEKGPPSSTAGLGGRL